MAKKHKGGGGAVEIIKERHPALYALSGSGTVLGACVLFMFFGFIFIADTMPTAVQIIMGIVFLLPEGFAAFFLGKGAGARDFKLLCQKRSPEDKDRRPVEVKPFWGFIYIAPFFVLMLLLSLIACAAKVQALQAIMAFLALPFTLFFTGVGVLVLDSVTWLSFVCVLLHALVLSAAYAVSYVINIKALRQSQARLITEMRSVRR